MHGMSKRIIAISVNSMSKVKVFFQYHVLINNSFVEQFRNKLYIQVTAMLSMVYQRL